MGSRNSMYQFLLYLAGLTTKIHPKGRKHRHFLLIPSSTQLGKVSWNQKKNLLHFEGDEGYPSENMNT